MTENVVCPDVATNEVISLALAVEIPDVPAVPFVPCAPAEPAAPDVPPSAIIAH